MQKFPQMEYVDPNMVSIAPGKDSGIALAIYKEWLSLFCLPVAAAHRSLCAVEFTLNDSGGFLDAPLPKIKAVKIPCLVQAEGAEEIAPASKLVPATGKRKYPRSPTAVPEADEPKRISSVQPVNPFPMARFPHHRDPVTRELPLHLPSAIRDERR